MNLSVRCPSAWRTKRVLARAVACGLLLALPACRIPALRLAEAGPDLPASFQRTTDTGNPVPVAAAVGGFGLAAGLDSDAGDAVSSACLGPSEFYEDANLTQLIGQALATNRELKNLEQEVQIASNEVLARRGAYLPFMDVGADTGFEKSGRFTRNGAVERMLEIRPGKEFPDPLPNTRLGLNFNWQLDIWHQLRNAQAAAVQRYFVASERRNSFVTKLVAEVAEHYYRLLALDQRIKTLDETITIQENSRQIAIAKRDVGRGTGLAVQRFQAEVRKNESEKLIVRQEIVETENRINFLLNRFPQPVARRAEDFFALNLRKLDVGLPAQLLQNRPDIRQAERELAAAGLDVMVARAEFYPKLSLNAGIGFEAFNPKYIFYPESFASTLAGNLVAPLVNLKAIQAEYMSANARQLQSIYNYQRVIVNAFTEVVNRMSMVKNYSRSIEIKREQLDALESSVDAATQLFQNARVEYIEVLFAQRDLLEARTVLIETKKQQLSAVVNAYQALGGGLPVAAPRVVGPPVVVGQPVVLPLVATPVGPSPGGVRP